MRFNSAIDWWFWAVLVFAAVSVGYAVLVSVQSGETITIVISVGAALIGFGLPLWLALATYYVIDGQQLLIRSGPFSWRIDTQSINSVTPTRSPLSSPALSFNRLEINYGANRRVLVSPVDHDTFTRALGH